MRIRRGLRGADHGPRVMAVGVFDGVHQGHARLLRRVRRHADRLGARAAVMTFLDHPEGTLSPERRPPRLAPLDQCLQRLDALAMDEAILIAFTRRFADLSAEDFVTDWLVRRLGLRHIVVGPDFMFGRGGRGNVDLLRRLGRRLGFGVTQVPPLRDHGEVVSSSGLRRHVAAGELRLAHRWLGRPYSLHGRVVHGDGRGARLGLPTANLLTRHEIVPTPGTYAVTAAWGHARHPALCHIGRRPTFHRYGPQTIEIYIPGWNGRLYGRRLEVHFFGRLRDETRFASVDALRTQVDQDWAVAQRLLAGPSKKTPA